MGHLACQQSKNLLLLFCAGLMTRLTLGLSSRTHRHSYKNCVLGGVIIEAGYQNRLIKALCTHPVCNQNPQCCLLFKIISYYTSLLIFFTQKWIVISVVARRGLEGNLLALNLADGLFKIGTEACKKIFVVRTTFV